MSGGHGFGGSPWVKDASGVWVLRGGASARVEGDFAVAGSLSFESLAAGSLLVQGGAIIDADLAEAFLVRKNGDGGDILTVDTTSTGRILFGADLYLPSKHEVYLDGALFLHDSGSGAAGENLFLGMGAGAAQAGSAIALVGIGTDTLKSVNGNYPALASITAVGYHVGGKITTAGVHNALYGTAVGGELTNEIRVTLLGAHAGVRAKGSNVTAVGYGTLEDSVSAELTVIGSEAGHFNIDGTKLLAAGFQALYHNTSGSGNLGLGHSALFSTDTNSQVTGVGTEVLRHLNGAGALGNEMTALGWRAGYDATSAYSGLLAGSSAGENITTAHDVVYLGRRAGYLMVDGNFGIFIGSQAADDSTGGDYGLAIGYNVQFSSATAANEMNIADVLFGTGLYDTVNGKLGMGTRAPASSFHVATGLTSSLRGIMSSQHNDGTDGAKLNLQKSRGTNGSPTVVVTGDTLGKLVAAGYDGANYLEMGSIGFEAEGTIATTRMPTRIVFSTATDAAPSVLTERLRIDSAGLVTNAGKFKSSLAAGAHEAAPHYGLASTGLGFYESQANRLAVAVNSNNTFEFVGSVLRGTSGRSGQLMNNAGSLSTAPHSFNGDDNTGLTSLTADQWSLVAGGKEVVRGNTATDAVNYLDVTPSAAGSPVLVAVGGTDTDIDLELKPKGTGKVRFGVYAAGAPSPTGYIQIKTEDGTSYNIPAVAA